MRSEQSQIIGIVGGMGPQAGLALYENIILNTVAFVDQQHLPVILMAFPGDIEDRTLFLKSQAGVNPAYEIINIIKKLVCSGASLIGIACNTSHSPVIFDVITAEINKLENKPTLLNMPVEVCDYISRNHPGIKKIGLMTTNGTYESGFYKNMLQKNGYDVIVPEFIFQNEVIHRMIYDSKIGIKANPARIPDEVWLLCEKAISFFKGKNVEAIILGCTEFSLLLKDTEISGIKIIDSTKCLALSLVSAAKMPTSLPEGLSLETE